MSKGLVKAADTVSQRESGQRVLRRGVGVVGQCRRGFSSYPPLALFKSFRFFMRPGLASRLASSQSLASSAAVAQPTGKLATPRVCCSTRYPATLTMCFAGTRR